MARSSAPVDSRIASLALNLVRYVPRAEVAFSKAFTRRQF